MELLNTHPIKKSDLGFHGNLFGGKLLSWIDASAAGYAMQLCDTPRMVTVSIDQCNFERPAKESTIENLWTPKTCRKQFNDSLYGGKST